MIDSLLSYREEFPILEHTTYLVSNSLGAMPRAVPGRLAEYAAQWGSLGVRAWANGWWEMPVTVGDEIAPLIGAGAGEVVMMPNVSLAQAAVLSACDYSPPRDTIVMTELDFPSVRYVFDGLAPRLGARVVVVPSDDGLSIDTERLCAAIDERTRLVSISHVLFRSAFIVDAEPSALSAGTGNFVEEIVFPREMIEAAKQKFFVSEGLDAAGGPPEEFRDRIRNDLEKWRKVVKEGNIVIGN